jgi:hypothetical protein
LAPVRDCRKPSRLDATQLQQAERKLLLQEKGRRFSKP